MASSKMKRMKQTGCKDQEELEEDNEVLFAELGLVPVFTLSSIKICSLVVVVVPSSSSST